MRHATATQKLVLCTVATTLIVRHTLCDEQDHIQEFARVLFYLFKKKKKKESEENLENYGNLERNRSDLSHYGDSDE